MFCIDIEVVRVGGGGEEETPPRLLVLCHLLKLKSAIASKREKVIERDNFCQKAKEMASKNLKETFFKHSLIAIYGVMKEC